jgi:integrase
LSFRRADNAKQRGGAIGDEYLAQQPPTSQSSLRFEVAGLDRKHWSSAGPIRIMFKQAFVSVGLPYFNPHSFRKTLAFLGGRRCRTPEEYKAWSQNLGHEHVLTTFCSYGDVSCYRQSEIIHLPVAALVLRLKIGRSAALVGTEFTPKESRGKTLQGT